MITTQNTALFTPNGDGYDIQPAGVLMLLAVSVYKNPHESTPAGRTRAKKMIDAILIAALAGGFKQGDILHTLLATGKVSPRVAEMAVAACDAAGSAAIGQLYASMRRND